MPSSLEKTLLCLKWRALTFYFTDLSSFERAQDIVPFQFWQSEKCQIFGWRAGGLFPGIAVFSPM